MVKKDFLLTLGDRTGTPVDTDDLLRSKIAERRRNEIERQEEIDEAKHEAQLAKLKSQAKTSEGAAGKADGKKEDSGFKITGGVNLGNIDLQEERRLAIQELKDLKKEQEDTLRAVGQENQQLRDKIHEQELKVLEVNFKAQMEVLTEAIKQNASRGNFTDQLNAARAIAEEIGYQKGSPAGGSSELIQVELKKLDFDHQLALRKMTKDDKAEERRWQIELRRLDDEREARRAELAQQQRKDEMLAKAPEVIGRAIGRAILEGGGVAETEAPVTSKAHQRYELQVPMGQGGTTKCPECQEEVGVGPTSRTAVCANCDTKIFIKRISPEAGGPIKGQETTSGEEEAEE
jgi:DNA-directed RNA polymerase subunit RPC12/RpoP